MQKNDALTAFTNNIMFNGHLYEKWTRNLPTTTIENAHKFYIMEFVKSINAMEKETGQAEQNH